MDTTFIAVHSFTMVSRVILVFSMSKSDIQIGYNA